MRWGALILACLSLAAQSQCPQDPPVQVVTVRGDPMPVWPRRYIVDLRDVNAQLATGYAESKRVWRQRLQDIWNTERVKLLWEYRDPTGVYQWGFFVDVDYVFRVCVDGDCHDEYTRDCRAAVVYVLENEDDGYWYGGAAESRLTSCEVPEVPNPWDAYPHPEPVDTQEPLP